MLSLFLSTVKDQVKGWFMGPPDIEAEQQETPPEAAERDVRPPHPSADENLERYFNASPESFDYYSLLIGSNEGVVLDRITVQYLWNQLEQFWIQQPVRQIEKLFLVECSFKDSKTVKCLLKLFEAIGRRSFWVLEIQQANLGQTDPLLQLIQHGFHWRKISLKTIILFFEVCWSSKKVMFSQNGIAQLLERLLCDNASRFVGFELVSGTMGSRRNWREKHKSHHPSALMLKAISRALSSRRRFGYRFLSLGLGQGMIGKKIFSKLVNSITRSASAHTLEHLEIHDVGGKTILWVSCLLQKCRNLRKLILVNAESDQSYSAHTADPNVYFKICEDLWNHKKLEQFAFFDSNLRAMPHLATLLREVCCQESTTLKIVELQQRPDNFPPNTPTRVMIEHLPALRIECLRLDFLYTPDFLAALKDNMIILCLMPMLHGPEREMPEEAKAILRRNHYNHWAKKYAARKNEMDVRTWFASLLQLRLADCTPEGLFSWLVLTPEILASCGPRGRKRTYPVHE